MKILASACIIFAVCIAASQSTSFFTCNRSDTPHPASPLRVRVKGCKVSPCRFPPGAPMIGEVDFRVNGYVESLYVDIFSLGKMGTKLYIDNNACYRLSNKTCPLYDNEMATYRFDLIPPSFQVSLLFKMFDQSQNLQVCFELVVG